MFPDIARDDVFRLETRRLWLRWPRASDAPAIAALAGDWDVARWTASIPHPYTEDDALRCIIAARACNARGAALRLALTLKTFPRKIVGIVGMDPCEYGLRLGFWLGRPYWGRGLMGEALEAVTDALFRITEAEKVSALVLAENTAARAMLEKCGFAVTDCLDGGPGRHGDSPTLGMVLPRNEWHAPRRATGLQPALAFGRGLS
ncbi:GNAT family N-acetyltransferase [Rhodoblastus acidophilus]|uniref:GNAT family N-acetyltransferase n=1 Tax=Candidatus Rhodoblastus alkanivorans TaxID=2954117 RepID=A0ABS9Z5G7_9HYPH|nr:GNAT family N-acetyltransferase [Candidatus Rhodoblastus alkanivorans]MCI4680714.1 GNAT family N-acetyltransferase [Candidatus Rhodoblastus alkanivorans]MCI4682321.1 GNAT family N-acetyltransferase [Candidatus Rhodoblastus alkanivorans]MDI4639623.1 GNAT family N-acetyltransferase [Rhodoblastus acidophilus]